MRFGEGSNFVCDGLEKSKLNLINLYKTCVPQHKRIANATARSLYENTFIFN